MIGWLLYLLLKISGAPWVLRLPVTLLPYALAAGVYFVLRRADEAKAALAALAFLLLPANVWAVLVTTDTPLIFFSFASVMAYWRGLERRQPAWQALAGAFLGLAFLSKYFAVLLGLAYVVYTVLTPRGRRDWRGLALVVACSLPFAAVNLWWNYEHCWANLMFNVYNRHESAGWSWKTPLLYAVSVLYLLSPVALWQLAKDRRAVLAAQGDQAMRFFAVMFAFPFGFFAVLSLVKQIGLHWMLGFVPFFFILAGWVLSREQLRRSVVYLARSARFTSPRSSRPRCRSRPGKRARVRRDRLPRAHQRHPGRARPYEGIRVRSRRLLARGHRLLLFREVLPRVRPRLLVREARRHRDRLQAAGRQEHPRAAQEPAREFRVPSLLQERRVQAVHALGRDVLYRPRPRLRLRRVPRGRAQARAGALLCDSPLSAPGALLFLRALSRCRDLSGVRPLAALARAKVRIQHCYQGGLWA
jgi:hypothetical protein